ncbi:MAG: molecular chaperone TorD family protein [Rhodocyclaceae bacterium]|nr:molecular chaperone TorD family protein [Rhodocyclaceae bacterium]
MTEALFLNDIVEALADDAQTLALIHNGELTAGVFAELRAIGFPDNLALLPSGERSREAWRVMADALAGPPAGLDAAELDRLAADFAAIYLTAAYGASPYESAWTDEDHLVCQESMFQLRDIYQAAGLAAADWRRRADDHLVLQLAFIAHATRQAATADDWRLLAKVMDEHLLRWLADFCAAVVKRCDTQFYAGLAMVTTAWCDGFRDLLATHLGEPRPSREEIEARLKPARAVQAEPIHFVPALGPTV